MLRRVRLYLPEALDFIYDGALRGVNIDDIMTNLGMLTTSPMYPAKGAKSSGAAREKKQVPIPGAVEVRGGIQATSRTLLYDGAPTVESLNVAGEKVFDLLELKQVRKERNKDGTWR
jgi:hypothetical protein